MIIKVNRARLMEAIRAKRIKVVEENFEKRKAYAADFKAYRFAVLKKLDSFYSKVQKATSQSDIPYIEYRNRLALPEAPDKPKDKANTTEYDAALAKLALSDEEVIQLNEKSDRTFLDLLG